MAGGTKWLFGVRGRWSIFGACASSVTLGFWFASGAGGAEPFRTFGEFLLCWIFLAAVVSVFAFPICWLAWAVVGWVCFASASTFRIVAAAVCCLHLPVCVATAVEAIWYCTLPHVDILGGKPAWLDSVFLAPLGFALVLVSIAAAIWGVRRSLRLPRHAELSDGCPVCNYSLAGLRGSSCPECGWASRW